MFSAITISLVPEAQGGPFVFSDGLDAGCQRAAELGFDAVEVFPRSAEELDVHRLKQLLMQHGLRLAGLGTGAGWVVRKLRLSDPDAAVRRRAVEFASSIVDTAGGFGAPAIIGSMQGRAEGTATRDQALRWLAEALEQLAPRAHAQGVPLLLEPLNRYETNLLNRVDDALLLLDTLQTRNVKLLCDLFHMNIEEPDICAAIRLAAARLGHLHFADSNRQAVGLGHTNMEPIVRALRDVGYDGCVSAEILPLPSPERAAEQTLLTFRRHFGAQ